MTEKQLQEWLDNAKRGRGLSLLETENLLEETLRLRESLEELCNAMVKEWPGINWEEYEAARTILDTTQEKVR